jgi:hypothetical protein
LPDALGQQHGQVVEEEIAELGRSAEGAVGRAVLALQPGQHLLEPGIIGVSRSCSLPGAGRELVGARAAGSLEVVL